MLETWEIAVASRSRSPASPASVDIPREYAALPTPAIPVPASPAASEVPGLVSRAPGTITPALRRMRAASTAGLVTGVWCVPRALGEARDAMGGSGRGGGLDSAAWSEFWMGSGRGGGEKGGDAGGKGAEGDAAAGRERDRVWGWEARKEASNKVSLIVSLRSSQREITGGAPETADGAAPGTLWTEALPYTEGAVVSEGFPLTLAVEALTEACNCSKNTHNVDDSKLFSGPLSGISDR